jgi:UDP-N-acetylmuramoyl-L-alanyl-D-glutamate--2,6-diaminopimelate ligase
MGAAAGRYADLIVVTTDNPRSENTAAIIDDIVAGLSQQDKLTVIEDRAAAIAWAIKNAADQDVVLVAGKGHENYQEVAGQRTRFSDYALAEYALAAREGIA